MRDETYDHWRLEDQFVEFVQFVAKHGFALFAVSILRGIRGSSSLTQQFWS